MMLSCSLVRFASLHQGQQSLLSAAFGEMAEWSNAPVLKTGTGL